MKTYLLFVGDEDGLHGPRPAEFIITEKPYVGFSGEKAGPDPAFVNEVIRRRSALKLSAVKFSVLAGYSRGYMSMVENGKRFPSTEAKDQIRSTLDQLESDKLRGSK